MNRFLKTSLIIPTIIIQLNGTVIDTRPVTEDISIESLVENRSYIESQIFKRLYDKGFENSFIVKMSKKYSNKIDKNKISKILNYYIDKKDSLLDSLANDIMYQRNIDFNNNDYILGLIQKSCDIHINYSKLDKILKS